MKNPAAASVFAQRLRELRGSRKLSQQALADIANVEKRTIQKIEMAQWSPTLDTLVSIARALGISMSELMNDPDLVDADSGM